MLSSKEAIFDEVDNLIYWPDREPKPVEYQEGGIRHRLIIQRANDLLKAGVPVIEVNLYDQVDGIHGESIVVAGAIEDNCVLTRAKFLQAQGVGQVIIDLALTANH